MPIINPEFLELESNLYQAKYAETAKLITVAAPKNATEARILAHARARLAWLQSDYTAAIQILENAQSTHGPNIANLCEQALLAYLNGNHFHAEAMSKVISKLLHDNSISLSPRARARSLMSLAKLSEEQGAPAQAIHLYREALSLVAESREFKSLIEANLLRILLYFGEHKPALTLYSSVSAHDGYFTNSDQAIEITYCLALADLMLVGAEHAQSRIERIAKLNFITSQDLIALEADIAEEQLFLSGRVSPQLRERLFARKYADLGPRERILLRFLEPTGTLKFDAEMLALFAAVSKTSQLNLALLGSRILKCATLRTELAARFKLLMAGLDRDSQILWQQRLQLVPTKSHSETSTLYLSIKARKLKFGNRELSLTARQTSFLALKKLAELQDTNQALDIEDFIKSVWVAPLTPTSLERARVLSRRLNSAIQSELGLSNFIQFRQFTISTTALVKALE